MHVLGLCVPGSVTGHVGARWPPGGGCSCLVLPGAGREGQEPTEGGEVGGTGGWAGEASPSCTSTPPGTQPHIGAPGPWAKAAGAVSLLR